MPQLQLFRCCARDPPMAVRCNALVTCILPSDWCFTLAWKRRWRTISCALFCSLKSVSAAEQIWICQRKMGDGRWEMGDRFHAILCLTGSTVKTPLSFAFEKSNLWHQEMQCKLYSNHFCVVRIRLNKAERVISAERSLCHFLISDLSLSKLAVHCPDYMRHIPCLPR